MKIEILTMWYNEEFLAPFFLNHYRYVDRIKILLDSDTDDRTEEICSHYPNVLIEPFSFPDMMDDEIKVNKLTEEFARLDCDWGYLLDADEFIFPMPLGTNPRAFLSNASGNLVYARMWQVYRHITEGDLSPEKETVTQRRHGDPVVMEGLNRLYNKPIIARPDSGIVWEPGNHTYVPNENIKPSEIFFHGAHWAMADAGFAVKRRILGRKKRQSRNNLKMGYTVQHHKITKRQIKKICQQHLNDPQLF